MHKISIIIPVYNTEHYLKQCIDSVINQSFDNIEIICINDCSTDNSQKILEQYSEKDNRIKIINNSKNIGSAGSRNKGIELALGDYIAFVDSDDWIDKDYIKKLYNSCIQNNTEIAICNFHKYDDKLQSCTETNGYSERNKIYENVNDLKYILFNYDINIYNVFMDAPWNRLIRKELLLKHKIRFQNLPVWDDVSFVATSSTMCNNISYVHDKLIYYRVNRGEQLTSKENLNPEMLIIAMECLYNSIKNCKDYLQYKNFFYEYMTQNIERIYVSISNKEIRDKYLNKLSNFIFDNNQIYVDLKRNKCYVKHYEYKRQKRYL